MPALYFTMTKDSLHISMLFRTRLDYEADRDDGLYNFVHVVHDKHLCRGQRRITVETNLAPTLCYGRTIRKVLGGNEGFFQLARIFLKSIAFAGFFCRCQVHCRIFFALLSEYSSGNEIKYQTHPS